ncbi:MAG TPA: TspO/MBR family protein [Gemmatimonadaceae bacterium]|nr:TspO/MBR family protein [Gemmatimonadaceae bacterium]
MIREILSLLAWIASSLAAGAIGGLASRGAPEFYAQLDRPPWAPPSWLFGPVWTTLYLLIGIAAWLVWRERRRVDVRPAIGLYVVQHVLNALWTWIFFAWRQGGLALAEIVVLALLIVATMIAFARVQRVAALLLVPYLGWVAFATALTAALWRRNPTLL